MVGATQESVSRVMSGFKRAGYIEAGTGPVIPTRRADDLLTLGGPAHDQHLLTRRDVVAPERAAHPMRESDSGDPSGCAVCIGRTFVR